MGEIEFEFFKPEPSLIRNKRFSDSKRMSNRGNHHRKNCLLAFIEKCLADQSLQHLIRWVDKECGLFQVLWVHAGRSNYQKETHGCLFDLYREYRGRGMASDPKQAFRMALKKSPCVRLKTRLTNTEDWRTFQIIKKCHKNEDPSKHEIDSKKEAYTSDIESKDFSSFNLQMNLPASSTENFCPKYMNLEATTNTNEINGENKESDQYQNSSISANNSFGNVTPDCFKLPSGPNSDSFLKDLPSALEMLMHMNQNYSSTNFFNEDSKCFSEPIAQTDSACNQIHCPIHRMKSYSDANSDNLFESDFLQGSNQLKSNISPIWNEQLASPSYFNQYTPSPSPCQLTFDNFCCQGQTNGTFSHFDDKNSPWNNKSNFSNGVPLIEGSTNQHYYHPMDVHSEMKFNMTPNSIPNNERFGNECYDPLNSNYVTNFFPSPTYSDSIFNNGNDEFYQLKAEMKTPTTNQDISPIYNTNYSCKELELDENAHYSEAQESSRYYGIHNQSFNS